MQVKLKYAELPPHRISYFSRTQSGKCQIAVAFHRSLCAYTTHSIVLFLSVLGNGEWLHKYYCIQKRAKDLHFM